MNFGIPKTRIWKYVQEFATKFVIFHYYQRVAKTDCLAFKLPCIL